MKHKKLLVLFICVTSLVACLQAANGDYRTKATGNWNALSTWERHDGTNWAQPTVGEGTPTSSSGVITIVSPHVVTVTSGVSVDQVTVSSGAQITINTSITLTLANGAATPDMSVSGIIKNAGTINTTGTLVFASGGKYQHNWPGGGVGTIPTATWNDGSVCEIINMDGTGSTTKLQGTSQSFYDFHWNTPLQDQSVYIRGDSFRPVRHDFKIISTGSSNIEVSMVEVAPWRLDITNYIQEGGIFTISRNVTGAPSYTMNISGDFDMSGGTLTTGSFTASSVVFNGSGTQTFSKTGGTLSGTINYTVNTGSTLDMGSSVITGSGSFTLQSGAGLMTSNTNGIASSGASGSIQVSGTRSYNSGANYYYTGTGQSTGSGLPSSVNNFTSTGSLTLTNTLTINGIYTGPVQTGTHYLDGYNGQDYVYMIVAESGNLITGFGASTTVGSNMPNKIDREWSIDGTYSGNKVVTFFWNASEDGYFDWSGLSVIPSVYKGNTEYTQTAFSVNTDPRWVTVSIPSSLSKATYLIGPANDQTLPIELSSFTATLTAQYFVQLHWVTQSETDALGYMIYRSDDNDLAHAVQVSPLINATNTTTQVSYSYTDSEVTAGIWYYWLQSLDLNGNFNFHGPVLATVTSDQGGEAPEIPVTTGIAKIYPNPFNPSATIKYGLKDASPVSFRIYNTRGQLVQSYDFDMREPATYDLIWDASSLPAGIYLIQMHAGNKIYSSKAVLSK